MPHVMTAGDVLSVLDLLRRANVEVWVGGGWGIDALVGAQTRDQRDLDLHPLVCGADGSATQGYEPSERDRHDMAQLRRVFGIATHF
jgi:hypothetical protein